ncbi:MAG: PadR family transcriptional regulator [Oscillibacter sp.]|nr:PadR family transcriptional regulator [Oscillibacter sp.]
MLKKELIELCLLHLLSQGDQYGYEILPRLRAAFPDTQESAVYAILRALGQAGCTKRYSGPVSSGPARKYLQLTETGRTRYQALFARWRALREALEELGVR